MSIGARFHPVFSPIALATGELSSVSFHYPVGSRGEPEAQREEYEIVKDWSNKMEIRDQRPEI